MRPSHTYPTLELRVPDCCTRIDDPIAIAALYRVLARRLYRDSRWNSELDGVDRALALENFWGAQRHGLHMTFVTRDGPWSVRNMLDLL
jgi:carboxylate-amine ligase